MKLVKTIKRCTVMGGAIATMGGLIGLIVMVLITPLIGVLWWAGVVDMQLMVAWLTVVVTVKVLVD